MGVVPHKHYIILHYIILQKHYIYVYKHYITNRGEEEEEVGVVPHKHSARQTLLSYSHISMLIICSSHPR